MVGGGFVVVVVVVSLRWALNEGFVVSVKSFGGSRVRVLSCVVQRLFEKLIGGQNVVVKNPAAVTRWSVLVVQGGLLRCEAGGGGWS